MFSKIYEICFFLSKCISPSLFLLKAYFLYFFKKAIKIFFVGPTQVLLVTYYFWNVLLDKKDFQPLPNTI